MKIEFRIVALLMVLTALSAGASTSWKGTSSTSWNTAANWTAGVPTASVDAIIGDANFTGSFQPTISGTTAKCLSLTVNSNATLTVSKGLAVSGNVTIAAGGTITHTVSAAISLTGNWSNSGTYSGTKTSSAITFAGTSQTLGGSSVTPFRVLTINASSTTKLLVNATVANQLTVNGTFDPNEASTFTLTGAGKLVVNANGRILVKASTFAGNYGMSGTITMAGTGVVDYGATNVNQTISQSITYGTLRISGSGTKTLGNNLTALNSTATNAGNIYVASGILDLGGFTANRGTTTAGGTFTVAAGATLRIPSTGTFPSNFASHALDTTSNVEYSGTSQTVSSETYGNLILGNSSGSVTKTMPTNSITVAGNLIATNGAGTALGFAAGASITVNGSITLGTGVTFNGGSSTHSFGVNWTNAGIYTGSSSTMTFNGANAIVAGTGTNNFFNVLVPRSGITIASNTSLTISGDLTASGVGYFTHQTGGTGAITLSGTSKSVSGPFIFNNLIVSGTITAASSFTIAGNLAVSGTLSTSAGTLAFTGSGKTISGNGSISFRGLDISGTLSTTNNFSVAGDLSVATTGSFSATAGTATFNGTTALSGTANLNNVTLNGTKLQLTTDSVLGIAGAFTITSGSFDTTTIDRNTVNYNGSGSQNITATTYNLLNVSGSGTKTAVGDFTVNRGLTIASGSTLNGGSGTHTIYRNFVNNGTFTAGTSTVQFAGTLDSTISGATTFNSLTVNKTGAIVTLAANVTAANLNVASGQVQTSTNAVIVTSNRTGNGTILGTITRTHTFLPFVAYAFEGPDNTITFSTLLGISSISVTTTVGAVTDFPFGASVNRQFNVSVTAGAVYTGTWRMHYEDSELNGNNESTIQLWRNNSSWGAIGKSSNSSTSNWVEYNGISSNLSGRWTLSDVVNVVRWNGSTSTAWETAANWSSVQGSPSLPPSNTDIVELGTTNFINHPTINTNARVKSISFGSAQALTLTLGGGSLTTDGNILGSWTNSASHTITVGSQTLRVGGDLGLSDSTNNHSVNVSASTGSIFVTNNLTLSGNASLAFSGAGRLEIGGNFNYSAATFTAGSGTVVYNGSSGQIVAPVTYRDLTINKASGVATLSQAATVTGNMLITNSGTLLHTVAINVSSNFNLASGASLVSQSANAIITVGGNWTCNGTFDPGPAEVNFSGTASQTIGGSTFSGLRINKTAGTATVAGNLVINNYVILTNGTLDMGTFTVNRSAVGGSLTLSTNTTLRTATNFPGNFVTRTLAANSTVEYYGSSTQNVSGETYGYLIFSNGGSNAKVLTAATSVQSDLLINSNSTFSGGSYLISLSGNWTNNGTFQPGNSTVKLEGLGKTFSGNTTVSNLTISGSYTVPGNEIYIMGNLTVLGSLDFGSGSVTLDGNLLNSGSLSSSGISTFTGTRVQTIQLLGALVTTSSGVINFNGSVAPVLSSTTPPQFFNLNINNTAGITPSVGWTVFGTCTIGSGATFNGGTVTHTFFGSVTNNGTITSSGILDFQPSSAKTLAMGSSFSSSGTVRFGGTGQLTLAGGAGIFNTVQIANKHAVGITANTNWNLSGDLVVSAGSLFNAGTSLTHTLSGNFVADGTFDGQTSTVALNGTTEISGNSSPTFYNLLVSGTATAIADFDIAGNFIDNGSFDSTGVDVEFVGSNPSTLSGTAAPLPIDSLVISKTAATATLATNVTITSGLTVNSGTLDASIFSIANGGTAALTLNAGGTLKIGGTNTLPSFSSYSVDAASTVEYSGTGSQTIAIQNYGNLTSSSSGARILPPGTVGIAGTFTPGTNSYTTTGNTVSFNGSSGQTIAAFNYNNLTSTGTGNRTLASSGTIGVAGTFTPGTNSYTVTGSTVNFSGSSQAVPQFAFNHLTLSGGSKTLATTVTVNGNLANSVTNSGAGKILLSGGATEHALSGSGTYGDLELDDANGAALSLTNLTLNGSLILTTGRLTTSTNKVVINSSGSVVRTNGLVLGFLQKNVTTGTNLARTFEVGTTNGYAPVTLIFGNVTVAGNVTAAAISGDHPSIGSSTLFSNKSVNLYWNVAKDASLAFNTNHALFNFTSSDLDTNTTPSKLKIGRYNSSTWTYPTIGTLTTTNAQATGLTNFGDFQLAENANTAPTLSNIGTLGGATEDTAFTINYTSVLSASDAADVDSDPISFRIETVNSGTLTKGGNPVVPGTTLLSTNESLVWTPNANANGVIAAFAVKAYDGTAVSTNTVQVSVNVAAVNDAPLLTMASNETINEGTTLIATNTATDVEGNTLTFSLASAPSGMSINSSSGVITWTPTEAQGPSTNTVSVSVTDNGSPNLSVTNSFTVTVNEVNTAPVLTVPGNQTIGELNTLTVTNSAVDSDIPLNTLTFALVSAPSGMSISSSSGVITWTPTEAQGPSTNTVSVSVTDNGSPNLSVTNSFTVTVNEVNSAPLLTVPGNQTINELTTLTVTNSASDADSPANALTFALVSAPTGMSINSSSGVITWTPTEAQGPSTNTVSVSVTDNGSPNLSVTNIFVVTVTDVNIAPVLTVPGNQMVNELTTLTVTNTANDADNDNLTFALVSAPTGMSINSNSGVITWTPTEAQGPGTNVISVSVTDDGVPALSVTNSFTVVVNEVNAAPIQTAPANQTIDEFATLSVTNSATDSDTPANALTFALVSAPSGVSIDSNSGVITWTPTEAQGPSTNLIYVKVTDDGSPALSTTNSFTVTVSEVNSAPVLNVSANQTIDELTTLTVTNTASDTDLPANTLTFNLVSAPSGMSINSSSGVITWTPTGAQGPGTNTILVSVTDNGSPALSVTNSFNVVVNDVTNSTVNQAPSFTKGSDVLVDSITRQIIITNWATNIRSGPTNEAVQQVTFIVTNDNAASFVQQPGISTNGTLSFEIATSVTNLLATVSVQLIDDGGTANGGTNVSAVQTFRITLSELFGKTSEYVSGQGPTGIWLGNLRGTKPAHYRDMVVANYLDNSVTVRFCNDDGTFTSPTTLSVGRNPQGVISGDFNQDGFEDIVTANSGTNTVSVLMNNIDRTFATAKTFVVGTTTNPQPVSVMVGYFDSDTKADIAVANYNENSVSILKGLGNGVFSSPTNYTVGAGPSSIWMGDYNSDGKADLITANKNANTVSVLPGVGNGTFGAAQTITLAGTPQPIFASSTDLTGDGKLDIVTANYGANTISILVQQSNGSFLETTNYAVGTNPRSVLLRDLNHDGYVDIATANSGSDSVSILLNNGNGTFKETREVAVGRDPRMIVGSNFNDDEATDLAVTDYLDNKVSIFVYEAPLAYSVTATLNEDTPTVVPVRTAMSGATFVSYFIVDAPTNGVINNTGTNVIYTPTQDFFGKDNFTYFARYENNGVIVDSAKATVALTINAVNDPPSFTLSTNLVTVLQGASAVTISNFASNISVGPVNETNQSITFVLTVTNQTFTTKPTISTNGVLKFQAATTAVGDALVQVVLQDNAYTANGGTNRSTAQTFIIRIVPNLIIPLKGTYNGLFYETAEVRAVSSGSFNFTMTDKGAYSGSLASAGLTYPLKGQVNNNGFATQTTTNGSRVLTLNLQMDLSNHSDQVIGTVSDGSWTAALLGDRATYNATTNPAPQFGSYTVLFPGTNLPSADPGDGYGLMTVTTAGVATLSGVLADGTSISRSTSLSKNGAMPVYVSLYGGKGALVSWLTLTNALTNSVFGDGVWIKGGGVSGKVYSAGFTNEFTTSGSIYQISTNGMPLNLTNAMVIFAGGNIAPSITNQIIFSPNYITPVAGQTNGLIITNVAKTGFVSGSFLKPGTTTRLGFKGVMLQQQNMASGFFIGTNQSGSFKLQAP